MINERIKSIAETLLEEKNLSSEKADHVMITFLYQNE
jgi:hypothetical protein